MFRSFLNLLRKSGKFQIGFGILGFFVLVALLSKPLTALIGQGQDPLGYSVYQAWLVPSPVVDSYP